MHKRYIDLSVFHEFNMKAKQEILIFTLHFYVLDKTLLVKDYYTYTCEHLLILKKKNLIHKQVSPMNFGYLK